MRLHVTLLTSTLFDGLTSAVKARGSSRGKRNDGAAGRGMSLESANVAFSALGSDLTVSISFSVALEFVGAAREAQLGDDELTAILVAIVIALTSIKGFVDSKIARALAKERLIVNNSKGDENVVGDTDEGRRGVLEFASLLLSILQRIGLSVSIQVLSLSVRASQVSRWSRILTLLGVVAFFVFFESAAVTRRR